MNIESSALLTDLYQLTMMKGYFDRRMDRTAVFEFFVRRLPPKRNFLIAVGLEQVLSYLETLRFTEEDLDWFRAAQKFDSRFLKFLRKLHFDGDVDAMPEGTIFFANEPILRVTAPLPIAQLVETRIINLLQFQTMIASKAARCVIAAGGKSLVDFGMRRAHGDEAAMLAARACYIAGFTGTSNVLAGKTFGIPVSGTMAHAFIQAHEKEDEAFENFARSNPDNAVFLLDTYDTVAAARKVVALAGKLKRRGIEIRGVRLDSGDFAVLSKKVRRILDRGGLRDTRILASGNLEEESLEKLTRAKVPIDGFGVGTRLITSWDFPYLESVYKLVEYDGRPVRKFSEGKTTLPGRKQVFRRFDPERHMMEDVITLEGDPDRGKPLLQPMMRKGKRTTIPRPLENIRKETFLQVRNLPKALRQLHPPARPYPISISRALESLA